MIYEINHFTRIFYEQPVQFARLNLRLEPAVWNGQHIEDFSLSVSPPAATLATHDGPYPVKVTRLEIDGPLNDLTIHSRFIAHVDDGMLDRMAQDASVADVAAMALAQADLGVLAPANYVFPSPYAPQVEAIAEWARPWLDPHVPALEAGLALAREIKNSFIYDVGATRTDTPVERAFTMRRGVCQDFAHVLVVALRSVGLPAAYASGYLRTLPPPGMPHLFGVDAMHAWTMLWCGPQRGWVGLDPTNGCVTGTDHIFTALGRDYGDVAPIDGTFLGAAPQHLSVSVDVMPLGG